MPELHELPQAQADFHHDLEADNERLRTALNACAERAATISDAASEMDRKAAREIIRIVKQAGSVSEPADEERGK